MDDLFLLSPSTPLLNVRSVDFQNTARVLVKTVTNFLRWPTFLFLYAHGKTLAVALPFDLRRQVSTQIRTAIRRVMLLIALVVPEHIDTIEIRSITRRIAVRICVDT